jgi:8-oxo-dGTP pyrophosphatase MutT (NUDIX family)
VSEEIKTRPTARVVLLDDEDRVLMLKIHDPSVTRGPNPITADFWLLVGGGVKPGESYEQAAYREVVEETGIQDVTIGRCVWTQEKVVADPAGEVQQVIGRYFVGRVASGVAVSFAGHEPLEAATIVGYRWFRQDEIVAREADETFVPPGLGTLLTDVINGAAGDPVSLTHRAFDGSEPHGVVLARAPVRQRHER